MSRPWLPLYVGDYLADTGHLRAAEHGAYLLLIMHYWQKGGLPDDDRQLSAIARMSPAEWKRARPLVEPFFKAGWRHERIERELADAQAAYERRAMAGRKGGEAKAANLLTGSNASSNASPSPDALLKQSQSQSHKNSEIADNSIGGLAASPPAPRKASRAKARTQIAEDAQPNEKDRQAAVDAGLIGDAFRTEWRRFRDHHRARGSLMADWSAAWRTWVGNVPRFQPARAGPVTSSTRNGVGELLAEMYLGTGSEEGGNPEILRLLPVDDGGGQEADSGDDGRFLGNARAGPG